MSVTYRQSQSVKVAIVEWTSDACGDAEETVKGIDGEILKIVTIPGEGCDQPDDNYGVVITDENGLDLALGLLANRDEANAEVVVPLHTQTFEESCAVVAAVGARQVHDGSPVTVTVSNAGAELSGTVKVYWR